MKSNTETTTSEELSDKYEFEAEIPTETKRDIYVGHAPSFAEWALNFADIAEAFGEENVTIMHAPEQETEA